MSSRAMVSVRFIELTNMTDKFTLVTLAELVDDTGVTFRDQAYIAKIMCVSRETINRSLGRLEEAGLVAREARWDSETHARKASIIRVVLDPEPCDGGSQAPVTQNHTPCDAESHPPVTEDHSIRDNLRTKQKQRVKFSDGRDSGMTPDADASGSVLDGTLDLGLEASSSEVRKVQFEQWYETYPKRTARARAERAFISARKKIAFEKLLERTRKYADINRTTDTQFIQAPDKWLTGECWDDEELIRRSAQYEKEASLWKKGVH